MKLKYLLTILTILLVIGCATQAPETTEEQSEEKLPTEPEMQPIEEQTETGGAIPLEEIEIFRVPQGTLISLRPGIWHHAPFTVNSECANVLIVLPERTYANDCTVYEIPEESQIEIESD